MWKEKKKTFYANAEQLKMLPHFSQTGRKVLI